MGLISISPSPGLGNPTAQLVKGDLLWRQLK